jgi:hypothetical protein
MPIQIDAKLSAFRRSSKGFFITLEVGPDSDWEELARAPLGQAFGVAMVPYDAETGKASPGERSGGDVVSPSSSTGQQRGEAGKPRKPFHEMSRAQQAGLLCQDARFALWLSNIYPEIEAKDAADAVRQICQVKSRAELSEDRIAAMRWDALLAGFEQETGRMAEMRG